MKRIAPESRTIVFSHMMKTAGTSFTKKLARHYGARLHVTQGGSFLKEVPLCAVSLQAEIHRAGRGVKVISGHNLRPHNFSEVQFADPSFSWITFLRHPVNRFVSQYYYDYKRSNGFRNKKYASMRNSSIEEWNKIEGVENYQTRFLSGEQDVEKAKHILSDRFEWIGFTEDFSESLESFALHFNLVGFDCTNHTSNVRNKDGESLKDTVNIDYASAMNRADIELYDFARSELWPRFKRKSNCDNLEPKKITLIQSANEVLFLINRMRVNQVTEFKYKNVQRFLKRWFR